MNWTVKISRKTEKYIKKLNKKLQTKVKEQLITLSHQENPLNNKNVKPLTGELHGFYRLRVGDYRIVFALMKEEKIIAVVNIAPRGDVYN